MKILRNIAIVAVFVALFGVIIAGVTAKPSPAGQVWDPKKTIGDLNAPNYYIMYTDLMCPYCNAFSRPVTENWDEFTQYLADHKILFEVRLTDYLYDNGVQASRDSAEAVYCAAREDRFWGYYHAAVMALWDDYQSKGIGVSKSSPPITDMPADYWLKIGTKVGLGENFQNCVKNHDTVAEIVANTERALKVAQGMPYFKFNRFTNSGFDNAWGWDYVKMFLDAGLGK